MLLLKSVDEIVLWRPEPDIIRLFEETVSTIKLHRDAVAAEAEAYRYGSHQCILGGPQIITSIWRLFIF